MRRMQNNLKHLARRFHRDKGKSRGKLPIMCFNCNKVGHIATRCSDKKNNRSGSKNIEVKETRTTMITKIKEISLAILLKRKPKMDLTTTTMKWCMLR